MTIIYDSTHTNIHNTLQEFNTIHPKLEFTLETETNNTINYLNITIHKQNNKLTFGIYRKPTFTDTMHNSSCHPYEHKKSAINYLINRMNTYQLTLENKVKKDNVINQILHNNGYPHSAKKINQTHKHNTKKQNGQHSHIVAPKQELL
jgi:hypothetical protein